MFLLLPVRCSKNPVKRHCSIKCKLRLLLFTPIYYFRTSMCNIELLTLRSYRATAFLLQTSTYLSKVNEVSLKEGAYYFKLLRVLSLAHLSIILSEAFEILNSYVLYLYLRYDFIKHISEPRSKLLCVISKCVPRARPACAPIVLHFYVV